MTACRLLKWALQKVASNANNQLRSVLKSYNLKNLCLYCIIILTITSEQNTLFSLREATGYFIEFIRISLEAKYLPYFFHGNRYLHNIFPGCAFGNEKTTYNLLAINSAETFIHARSGFQDLKRILHGLYLERKQLDYKKIKLTTSIKVFLRFCIMFIPSFNVKSKLRCCKSYVYDNNTINELHKSNGIHLSKVLIIYYTSYLYFIGHIAVTC